MLRTYRSQPWTVVFFTRSALLGSLLWLDFLPADFSSQTRFSILVPSPEVCRWSLRMCSSNEFQFSPEAPVFVPGVNRGEGCVFTMEGTEVDQNWMPTQQFHGSTNSYGYMPPVSQYAPRQPNKAIQKRSRYIELTEGHACADFLGTGGNAMPFRFSLEPLNTSLPLRSIGAIHGYPPTLTMLPHAD